MRGTKVRSASELIGFPLPKIRSRSRVTFTLKFAFHLGPQLPYSAQFHQRMPQRGDRYVQGV